MHVGPLQLGFRWIMSKADRRLNHYCHLPLHGGFCTNRGPSSHRPHLHTTHRDGGQEKTLGKGWCPGLNGDVPWRGFTSVADFSI